jgi:hypothetical protein
MVSLETLLREADFVSLNTDLNPTSHHLISTPQLALMKARAYLINASRGPVVDEPALARALKDNRIAGAALGCLRRRAPAAGQPVASPRQLSVRTAQCQQQSQGLGTGACQYHQKPPRRSASGHVKTNGPAGNIHHYPHL